MSLNRMPDLTALSQFKYVFSVVRCLGLSTVWVFRAEYKYGLLHAFHRRMETRNMTRSKLHPEDTHILGVTAQNLVSRATWCPEFVHP